MNNYEGVKDARDRLRNKAQNEQTSVTFSELLRIAEQENKQLREESERLAGCVKMLKIEHAWNIRDAKRLTEENVRLRKDAERMNGDIADLRQLIARYRERELTMGWNKE